MVVSGPGTYLLLLNYYACAPYRTQSLTRRVTNPLPSRVVSVALCIVVCRYTFFNPNFKMLRRIPTTNDGKVVDRLQESTRINKPFKPPTLASSSRRDVPQRKRKRVSYKGLQGEEDSESDSGPSRKKKKRDTENGNFCTEEEMLAAIKMYPVYKPKPFDQVGVRRFSMPSMTNKDGILVPLIPTYISLGIRPKAKIFPRPLHDPMEDHAIVLYDPTIDDRETDEERKEREKEEAKDRAATEARERTAGMFNPHKSLRSLLGEDRDKKRAVDKVPVVIDPQLTKVLRPHQVEGVKVKLDPRSSYVWLIRAVLI